VQRTLFVFRCFELNGVPCLAHSTTTAAQDVTLLCLIIISFYLFTRPGDKETRDAAPIGMQSAETGDAF